jgi:hypothetical protein
MRTPGPVKRWFSERRLILVLYLVLEQIVKEERKKIENVREIEKLQ